MRRVHVLFIASWLVMVCACAVLGPGQVSSEQALRRRAEGYWAARQEKDWKKVQTFVDPMRKADLEEYFKKLEQSKDFSNIVSFSIRDLKVSGDEGHTSTVVALHLLHPLLGTNPYPFEQTVENTWVRRDGRWYVVIEPPNILDILQRLNQRP